MMRSSPIKTPMQKLSTAAAAAAAHGSRLIDSASTAAAQGTQLSNVVVSRAGATVGTAVEEVKAARHSPHRRVTPGAGIRDRINKFDSASKSNLEAGRRRERHQWSRFRSGNGGAERHRREPSPSDESHREDGERGKTTIGRSCLTRRPPPYNPSFREKENEESNRKQSSDCARFSFTGGNGTKNMSSVFRRKKASKKDRKRNGMVKTTAADSSPVRPNYCETRNEREMKTPSDGRNHQKERKDRRRDEQHHEDLNNQLQKGLGRKLYAMENQEAMNIADLNYATVIPTRPNNNAEKQQKQKNGPYDMRSMDAWDPHDHPLIQGPLRKHIWCVHNSAKSNAMVTVVKKPFPLLPPDQSASPGAPLATVAGWDVSARDPDGVLGHLDKLGSVTGNLNCGGRGRKEFGGAREERTDGASGRDREADDGEALDLLASAAFLFKTSRRNIG